MNQTQKLVQNLAKKNPAVYNWLLKRGVDFHHLHTQAASFVTAASFLLTLPRGSSLPPVDIEIPPAAETVAPAPKKKPLTDLERGQKVWAEYGQFIREAAAEYDVDPNLIFATIMIESGGNPRAIRHEPRIHDASYGLGQILYGTARGLGYRGAPEGLFDPETNIKLIAIYHKRNQDKYGHLTPQQLTIAYNTGSPNKKPWPGHITKFNKWYNRVDSLEVDLT